MLNRSLDRSSASGEEFKSLIASERLEKFVTETEELKDQLFEILQSERERFSKLAANLEQISNQLAEQGDGNSAEDLGSIKQQSEKIRLLADKLAQISMAEKDFGEKVEQVYTTPELPDMLKQAIEKFKSRGHEIIVGSKLELNALRLENWPNLFEKIDETDLAMAELLEIVLSLINLAMLIENDAKVKKSLEEARIATGELVYKFRVSDADQTNAEDSF